VRDRLLAEIGTIASAELAASWAREALAIKNKLAAPDAKLVEDSFEQLDFELLIHPPIKEVAKPPLLGKGSPVGEAVPNDHAIYVLPLGRKR
jgi:hypothetical protein